MTDTPKKREPQPIIEGAILAHIQDAAAAIGRGQSFIYEAIADGRIKAVKSDKRTLVVVDSLREYASALPPAKIKSVGKRERNKAA